MTREKLICDKRSGCVAIYKQSQKDETNGCHPGDERNIVYSDKGSKFNGSFWEMDKQTQQVYQDMVDAYNEKYCLGDKELTTPNMVCCECGYKIPIYFVPSKLSFKFGSGFEL
jgi:hypothetical protein